MQLILINRHNLGFNVYNSKHNKLIGVNYGY